MDKFNQRSVLFLSLIQAIALVLGFIVTAALIIIMVFAIKTRQRINYHGKDNILWRRVKEIDTNSPQDVEDWVSTIFIVQENQCSHISLKYDLVSNVSWVKQCLILVNSSHRVNECGWQIRSFDEECLCSF